MTSLCNEIEKFGKGIGNTTRYKIVEALLKGRKTVGELVDIVKISQPAVSQHLKTLKACDLVIDERRGQEVFYAVNVEHTLHLLQSLVKDVQSPACKKDSKKY